MAETAARCDDYLRLEFPSRPENIGVARLAVASFASRLEFTVSEIQHDIRVAVSEAVTNAVVHAYPSQTGKVVVEAWVEGVELHVVVEDWGKGFRPGETAGAADPEAEHMGIGLEIIGACMDQVQIESVLGTGTRLMMVKRPAREPEVAAGGSTEGSSRRSS